MANRHPNTPQRPQPPFVTLPMSPHRTPQQVRAISPAPSLANSLHNTSAASMVSGMRFFSFCFGRYTIWMNIEEKSSCSSINIFFVRWHSSIRTPHADRSTGITFLYLFHIYIAVFGISLIYLWHELVLIFNLSNHKGKMHIQLRFHVSKPFIEFFLYLF